MSSNRAGASRYGIHSIDHFALEVPSLDVARTFFTAFGLRVSDEAGDLALRASASDHVWARIRPGPGKHLAWLALRCWPDELQALIDQALDAGAQGAEPPADAPDLGQGAWLRDMDGNLLHLIAGTKTSPQALELSHPVHREPNQRTMLRRSQTGAVHPRRLSHVLMFTPDINRAIAFYEQALGLRMSDRSGDGVVFMHARHGSDHHLIAFARSEAKGWHHSAWDVDGIDEVGKGSEQMRDAGYREGWGTGRHVLGSNYFHYVRDPWGSFAEYSADIDFIPTGSHWDGGDHPAEDSLYLWGPPVPEYFLANTDA